MNKFYFIFLFISINSCIVHKSKARKISNSFEKCLTKSNLISNDLIKYGLSEVINEYKQELKNNDTIHIVFESGIQFKSIYIFHKYKSLRIKFSKLKYIYEIKNIDTIKHNLRIYQEIYLNKSFKMDCWFWGEGNMYVYYFKMWSLNTNEIELRMYKCDSLARDPFYPKSCIKTPAIR